MSAGGLQFFADEASISLDEIVEGFSARNYNAEPRRIAVCHVYRPAVSLSSEKRTPCTAGTDDGSDQYDTQSVYPLQLGTDHFHAAVRLHRLLLRGYGKGG